MVCGRICLAHGSITFVCTGRLSLVPALAAAVRAVGFGAAHHHLDSKHHPHLLRLAFAHAWSSVDSSRLGYAAGIRIRGSGRRHYPVAPAHTTRNAPTHYGLGCTACATALSIESAWPPSTC